MKKFYFLLLVFSFFTTAIAQIVNIPDSYFKAKLLAASTSNTTAKDFAGNYFKIDANSDGQIQLSEALLVKQLNISNTAISSLVGITSFTNIQILNCQGNLFTSLDVSALTNLQTLNCGDSQNLSSLNVSGLTSLQRLDCSRAGNLPLLNVHGLTNLQTLDCYYNNLQSLDVSGLTNLQTLNCGGSNLTSLNVTGLVNLQNLWCEGNQLSSLDASGLTNLKTLYCGFNRLTTLNVVGLTNLQDLICEGNQLSSLDLTGLINLITMRSQENSLTSINLNGLANLEVIDVLANNLSVLDLTGLSKLKYLDCDVNQLTSLDLSGLNNLLGLIISSNNISNIDVSQSTKLENLYCGGNQLTSLDLRGLNSLQQLYCGGNPDLSCISVDNVGQANQNNNWDKDSFTIYSLDCTANQVPLVGQTFATNGINYIVTKDTLPYEVAVGSNTGFVGAATIPVTVSNGGNSFAVKSIGNFAFDNCTGLTSVTIPNSVTSINRGTFSNCRGLTSVSIPNSITSIGDFAFSDCSSLTSVTIPDSVINIDNDAFSRCTGLTSVTIGNAVTFIGSFAFSDCIGLTSINIPASVTIIDILAFDNCPRLTSVTVNWAIPIEVGREIFGFNLDDNGDLDLSHITLYVPAGTQAAYDAAEVWTSFRSVNDVDNVFNYCKGAVATTLVSPFPAGSIVRWYTVATGGRPLATAPTPITTTVGTKLFYVSQVVGGVESPRTEITVNTFALPTTPGTITGTASQGVLVGTTTTATFTIAAVLNATSYTWTAPTGVNIVSGQGTNTLTVNFADVPAGAGAIGNLSVIAINSNDCNSLPRNLALTKALPSAPSSIRMTNAALPLPLSGIRPAITTFAPFMGTSTELTLTANPSLTATSYVWELPTGVNVTNGSATTVGGVTESTSNVITVNFLGVTNTNTFNYLTSATVPVSTNTLRIGVYSKNGTGLSTTNNAALANSSALFTPNHTSTARLLTLTALRPVAPTSLKMYNPLVSNTVAVTDISTFIGTTTALTLTATESRLSSSYSWEIPSTVTVVAGSDVTSNSITVNFLNVPAGTTSLYLGVKAVNGMGSSVTNNSALTSPATTSDARLLKVTAVAPSLVGTVTGSLRICPSTASSVTYSIAMVATRANSYNITVPAGCTIDGGTTNTQP